MLSTSLVRKLDEIQDRYEELERLLAEPEVTNDRQRFPVVAKEYSDLTHMIESYQKYRAFATELEEAEELQRDTDPEIRELAESTISQLKVDIDAQTSELHKMLLPVDPNDASNVYIEIRPGTGGEESALFVSDLRRMYEAYASLRGWECTTQSATPTGIGGYKHVDLRIDGKQVFGQMKFEAGTHRVQRVPKTESQGRIHTSACTVAILPETDKSVTIEIDKKDLRIDTFRASGAGGQHVNKTDSAVRITHLPTNTVVECQQERSQLRNREQALAHLVAKLTQDEKERLVQLEAEDRKAQVGSGDRSERIRTYNFPQGRVTDHRINLTIYKLDEVLTGALDQVIEPLRQNEQVEKLKDLQSLQ